MYEYANSFGKDSWQRTIVIKDYSFYQKIYDLSEIIVRYENKLEKDKFLYESAKEELEKLKNILSRKTEKEYIKEQIEICEEELELEDSYSTRAKLETLKLRYEYGISYTYNNLNDYLENCKEKHENKVFYVSNEEQQSQYIKLFKNYKEKTYN